MSRAQTIIELLKNGEDSAAAIAAPGRESLSYGGLRDQVEKTARTLNGLGIGRNDPVAIVMPNGPEMASAFLSVSSVASSAPLNPAYRRTEFEFYLSDLKARALMLLEE